MTQTQIGSVPEAALFEASSRSGFFRSAQQIEGFLSFTWILPGKGRSAQKNP